MMGCWVSNLTEDGFDTTNGDEKQVTAQIQYDKAFMELPEEL